MRCQIFFLISLFLSLKLWAQDERQFRKLLKLKKNEARSLEGISEQKIASTSFYQLDLNGDDRYERFLVEKVDGIDHIVVQNYKGEVVFREAFDTKGLNSRVHRIHIKKISDHSIVLCIYFFEGTIDYLEFNGTGRLYFLTMDNNDFKTMSMYKGPLYWHEWRSFKGEYSQRRYNVKFTDLNSDGVKEILVKHHLISRAYLYLGKGEWRTFSPKSRRL